MQERENLGRRVGQQEQSDPEGQNCRVKVTELQNTDAEQTESPSLVTRVVELKKRDNGVKVLEISRGITWPG